MKKVFFILVICTISLFGDAQENSLGSSGTETTTSGSGTGTGTETTTSGTKIIDKDKTKTATSKDVSSLSSDQKTKLRNPIENFMKATQFSLFLKEFEMSLQYGFCGDDPLNMAIGFKAHMIEPIGYMEQSKKPFYFPFADITMKESILRFGASRTASVAEGQRDELTYNHFIVAPIMGMIFRKQMGFVCFRSPDISIPVLNELNPAYNIDLYGMKMIPQMMMMMSPQAILSTILDCGATMTSGLVRGYFSKDNAGDISDMGEWAKNQNSRDPNKNPDDLKEKSTKESDISKKLSYLTFIRNTMYYNDGCLGMAPVGGYANGSDPGTDAQLIGYGTMANLSGMSKISGPFPTFQKQTEFGMNLPETSSEDKKSSLESTMCRPKDFYLPIESQYLYQMVYPTVGSAVEQGATGLISTSFKNVPGAKDQFVFMLWERRDYYAFAYFCKSNEAGDEK
jgi:hypothetical protein